MHVSMDKHINNQSIKYSGLNLNVICKERDKFSYCLFRSLKITILAYVGKLTLYDSSIAAF